VVPGRAVQVDPMRPTLKASGTKRLKLTCGKLLSNLTFKFHLRRYNLGWKSLFSEELLAHERMRRQLNVALDMMNQAVTGEGVAPPPAAAAAAAASSAAAAQAAQTAAEAAQEGGDRGGSGGRGSGGGRGGGGKGGGGGGDAEMSLKEAVEAFAEAHDLSFLPKPGRSNEGLQVYSFGKVSVTVNTSRQLLRAQVGER